jgi:hypothetical protein
MTFVEAVVAQHAGPRYVLKKCPDVKNGYRRDGPEPPPSPPRSASASSFGPIIRKDKAVTSKATQGQDRCLAFYWFRSDTTSSGSHTASANCMYNGEYGRRWRWSCPSGRVSHPTPPMTASSLSPRQPVPTSSVPNSSKKPSQEAKDERLNFRANERLVSILAQLKDEYGITMSESIRRGVALFSIAIKESSKGKTLAFIDQEGKVVSEIHTI